MEASSNPTSEENWQPTNLPTLIICQDSDLSIMYSSLPFLRSIVSHGLAVILHPKDPLFSMIPKHIAVSPLKCNDLPLRMAILWAASQLSLKRHSFSADFNEIYLEQSTGPLSVVLASKSTNSFPHDQTLIMVISYGLMILSQLRIQWFPNSLSTLLQHHMKLQINSQM